MTITALLAVLMLVVAGLVYARTRTSSHPAVIMALFWFLVTILPILAVGEAVGSIAATGYLLAAVAAFAAPSMLLHWNSATQVAHSRQGTTAPYGGRMLLTTANLMQLLCVGLMIANITKQGFDVTAFLANPLEVACLYLGGRYSGELTPTIFGQVATVLNYVGVSLVGVALASRRGVVVRLASLSLAFVPSLMAVLLMADKGTIFLAIAFFYGGVLVARVAVGRTNLLNWTTIGTCALALAVVVPVMLLALLNRGDGSCSDTGRTTEIFSTLTESITSVVDAPVAATTATTDPTDTPVTVDEEPAPPDASVAERSGGLRRAVLSYAFGHYFAFSDWFDHYFFGQPSSVTYSDPPGQTWGYWTFMAFGKIVYPEYKLPPGYFDEYVEVGGVLKTNIFTMFRGLIYDFGLVGSLLAMAGFGFVSALIYRRMLHRPVAPCSQAAYILVCGAIYTSYIISLLIWNSAVAMPFGVAAALAVVAWQRRTLSPGPR